MKKLSNTEAELKNALLIKKTCTCDALHGWYHLCNLKNVKNTDENSEVLL